MLNTVPAALAACVDCGDLFPLTLLGPSAYRAGQTCGGCEMRRDAKAGVNPANACARCARTLAAPKVYALWQRRPFGPTFCNRCHSDLDAQNGAAR